VGRAMARNRICLFIPCHRVVGAAGPGGFGAPGGVRLKRRLLSLERRKPRA
jgi:methylated-DNA-[protein]-cysteine S-methyltransferase